MFKHLCRNFAYKDRRMLVFTYFEVVKRVNQKPPLSKQTLTGKDRFARLTEGKMREVMKYVC